MFRSHHFLALCATLSLTLATPQAQASEELEQAFHKEFVFLESQKKNLQQRLQEFREQADKEHSEQTRQINGLENSLLSLENRNEQLGNLLSAASEKIQSIQSQQQALQATFDQASVSLKKFDNLPQIAKDQGQDERLTSLLAGGVQTLQQLASVRRSEGEFFLANGKKVVGEILSIGRIAAFGFSDQAHGALAPAGEGQLKLWQKADAVTVNALTDGNSPDTLQLFLFENLNAGIEDETDKTVADLINSGGSIGWIIVMLGVLAAFMIVMRVFFLRRAGVASSTLMDSLQQHVIKRELSQALELCQQGKGAIFRVVAATLRNVERDREHIEDIVSESILHENRYLNRHGTIIMVIAAVSPLLGLLGTVTGMIATFDVITQFGTGDPKLLSGGISTALVTTQLGLIVAIPALILGNLLNGWSNRIKDDMEKAALSVINLYEHGADLSVEDTRLNEAAA